MIALLFRNLGVRLERNEAGVMLCRDTDYFVFNCCFLYEDSLIPWLFGRNVETLKLFS